MIQGETAASISVLLELMQSELVMRDKARSAQVACAIDVIFRPAGAPLAQWGTAEHVADIRAAVESIARPLTIEQLLAVEERNGR